MANTLARQRPSIGDTCQSGKMATVEYTIFVLKFPLCLTTVSNIMSVIVKWCSGVVCNWCVSLDIALILALETGLCSLPHIVPNDPRTELQEQSEHQLKT